VFRIQKVIWLVSEYLGIYLSHLSLLLLIAGFSIGSSALLILALLLILVVVSKWYKLRTRLFQTLFISVHRAPKPQLSIQFKNGKRADFYLTQKTDSPAIIFLFGGGFVSGDTKQYSYLNRVFNSLGYHCVQLEYSYLPTHNLDATLLELTASLQELLDFKNNVYNPSYVILGGRSAGAYLALQVSRKITSSKIHQLLLLYPPVVISHWLQEWMPKVLLPMGQLRKNFFFNQKTEMDLVRVQDFPKERAYCIFTGDQDLMVPHHHSVQLKMHLEKMGCKVNLDILPTEPHGFESSPNTLGGQKFLELLTDRLSTNP
jgi:acetyl esterase/lipase